MVAIIDQNADLNRDGIVDNDDFSLLRGDEPAAEPAGQISAPASASGTDNIVGYAGYIFNAEIHGGGLYTVRHRHYLPELGRWVSRDPLGYVDGMSLYEYVRSRAIRFADPSGTFTVSAEPRGLSCPEGIGKQVPYITPQTSDYDKCCTALCAEECLRQRRGNGCSR